MAAVTICSDFGAQKNKVGHCYHSFPTRRSSDLSHGFSSKEQVSLNFMAAVTICSDFGAQKNKVSHCFHCFPSISHEVMGPDAMILVF